jgi:hypothetical protein
MEDSKQMNLTFDFGAGRYADVEFGGSDQLWVAAGRGFASTDLWLKDGPQSIDLRVRVRRTAAGIEVAVDRGGNGPWWPDAAAPRLRIEINTATGVAAAVASVGTDHDFQEVVLGESAI